MVQIVSGVRRLLVVTREFVLAALDDGFWEGCGQYEIRPPRSAKN